MPLYTTEALVLRTYNLGEVDRIVVFLTRDRGKKRGVAQGARRLRSRFAGALEPLTCVRVAYFEKEARELVSLNYAEPVTSPLWAPAGDALGYTEYFAELIDEWAPEGDPNERLYRLGSSVVGAMGAGVPIEPLARYFEYWLLRLQGVYPSLLVCRGCGTPLDAATGVWLLAGEHIFSCDRCSPVREGARAVRVSADALQFLRAATTVGPERVGELACSPRVLAELESAHRMLIGMHLEKELKSARVLRDLR